MNKRYLDDPRFPLICMDELSKQLTIETQTPLPAEPGQPERFDDEYERNGTANVFAVTEPLTAGRLVVTTQRTKTDWPMPFVSWPMYNGRMRSELSIFFLDNALARISLTGVEVLGIRPWSVL
jgi:hypothetical protein